MEPAKTPHPLKFLPVILFLFVVGWGGLFFLVNLTLPTLGPRWLFFFLLALGATGTALPISAYLNFRFESKPPATANVIVRQALWVGVFVATAAWFQYGRVLSMTLALMLAIGLFVLEIVLRIRERSQWRPKDG